MGDVRWLDEREMSAWRGYVHMRRDLDNALNQQLLCDAGLSSADYELLVPLSEADQRRLRAIELRTAVGWEKSRLSHQVRRMEQRGLLRRVECPSDARSTYIELTDEGIQAIESAAPLHVAMVRKHFIDLLTPDELDLFGSVAERVIESLACCPRQSDETAADETVAVEAAGPPPLPGGGCPAAEG